MKGHLLQDIKQMFPHFVNYSQDVFNRWLMSNMDGNIIMLVKKKWGESCFLLQLCMVRL